MTRQELRAEALTKLYRTPVNHSVFFPLPKPGRRVLAQTINQAAHKAFGPRCYRMRSIADGVWITRTDPMLHPVTRRRLRDGLDAAGAHG